MDSLTRLAAAVCSPASLMLLITVGMGQTAGLFIHPLMGETTPLLPKSGWRWRQVSGSGEQTSRRLAWPGGLANGNPDGVWYGDIALARRAAGKFTHKGEKRRGECWHSDAADDNGGLSVRRDDHLLLRSTCRQRFSWLSSGASTRITSPVPG
ncbi:TPA: hypothetical protein ACTXAV_005026 [Raoultella planticola]|uniref:hypothetical protein n=1 Tax=Raoultella planticola TaxID=575 RepID=UPI000FDB7576|nr:hypothetical protein [Raoultella planticola]EKW3527344.1 hypothetical protein [Raoultella planticola]ELC3574232.1 hypothetical protein [Raoultella planticola]ELF4970676.1 hypothetical protein [Raoultella planticola]ELH7938380.1 hypothetical protein [Raoultella planticola]ELU0692234.1 hypothetical protein [Raoultella planticola]